MAEVTPEKDLTVQDVIMDSDLSQTLLEYSHDRGKDPSTPKEAFDNFLYDYRGMQSNTLHTMSFVNYIKNIEDEEYKGRLGTLYETVDDKMETLIGLDTAEGLKGIGQWAYLAVSDPVNILGLGLGKQVGMMVARPIINNLIKGSLKTKMTQAIASNPIKTAAVGAALPEAVITPYMETAIQTAEVDLDVRDDYSVLGIAGATGVSMLAGGAFGFAGEGIIQGLRKGRDEKAFNAVMDELEGTTIQGTAARADSIADADQKAGLYVKLKSGKEPDRVNARNAIKGEHQDFDTMGRVVGENDDGTLQVEFISAQPDNEELISRMDFSFAPEQLEVLTERSRFARTRKYRDKNKLKFVDRDSIRNITRQMDELVGDDRTQMDALSAFFDSPEKMGEMEAVLRNMYDTNRDELAPFVDHRMSVMEASASVMKRLDATGKLPSTIKNSIDQYNATLSDTGKHINAEDFLDMYRYQGSQAGKTLQFKSGLSDIFWPKVAKAEDNVPDGLKNYGNAISQDMTLNEINASKYGLIDAWRGLIVSQPATTLRNIAGSTIKAPEVTFRSWLDDKFINMDRGLQGLPPLTDAEKATRSGRFATRIIDPENSIDFVTYLSEIDPRVNKVMGDTFGNGDLWKEATSPTTKAMINFVRGVNVLNRAQDQMFKAAAFMSEIQTQINFRVNRGVWEGGDILTPEQIIGGNRLDLLDDEMVARGLGKAYEVTYQSRNVGDSLPKLWKFNETVNSVQAWANKREGTTKAAYLAIPFPNFLLNATVYTLNHMGGGALKSAQSIIKLRGVRETASANRKRLGELETALAAYKKNSKKIPDILKDTKYEGKPDAKGKYSVNKRVVADEIAELSQSFGDSTMHLNRMKEGLAESAGGIALLTAAVGLRMAYGGDTWNELKDPNGDTSIDMTPFFPVPGFMWAANAILYAGGHESGVRSANPLSDAGEVLLNVDGRSGVLKGMKGIERIIEEANASIGSEDQDPQWFRKVGLALGASLGNFLGGFGTPIRPAIDLWNTVEGVPAPKDRRMQSVLAEAGLTDLNNMPLPELTNFVAGTVDNIAKNLIKNTPLEDAIFSDTPDQPSIVQEGTKEKHALPILKQLTGGRPIIDTGPLGTELKRQGVEEWKLRMYTEVPAYDNAFNAKLGVLASRLAPYVLSSPEYISAPREEGVENRPSKRELLIGMFKAGGTKPGTPASRRVMDFTTSLGAIKSLNDGVKKQMEEDEPELTALKNFKSKYSKKKERLLYNFLANEPEERGGKGEEYANLVFSRINRPPIKDPDGMIQLVEDLEWIEKYFGKRAMEYGRSEGALNQGNFNSGG